MDQLYAQLMPMLTALWWPFVRIMAMFSMAPVLGDGSVQVTVRVLLALALSFVMLPMTHGGVAVDPISLQAIVATVEQAVIGGVLGLAFQFSVAVISVLGFLVSSQVGFSMAVMNDPMNGQQSDVISSLLSVLSIMVFFAMDGHLLLAGVIGASFHAWPIGHGYGPLLLQTVAFNSAWIFAAAMLLAIPIVFSTLVVQLGFGFLNRVAPSLNLYSLGFSIITVFGLLMLVQIVRFVPQHYIGMTDRVLEMLRHQMEVATHG
jgi:flagellar biosynthetic protein FliR